VQTRLLRYSNLIFLLAAACILLAWLVPNHYFPWVSFYNDFLAGVALWLLLLGLTMRNNVNQVPLSVLLLLLFALIPVLQFLLGIIFFAGDAFIVSVYLTGFAVAVFVGQQLFSDQGETFFFAVAVCLVCAATLSSFVALYQWFGLSHWGSWVADMRSGGRPFANLGQPNNFAVLTCLGLVSVLYLWERKTLGRSVSVLIGGLLLVGVVLSQSRTPWVIAFVLIIWWLWQRNRLNLQLKAGAIIGCLGIYGLLLYALPLINEWYGVSAGLHERALEVDDVRGVIWQQLWYAVWHGPLWGYGWNQLGIAQVSVATETPPSLYTEHSHNFFLDLLIWNGPVLGIILVLAIVYWGFKQAFACQSLAGWYGLACIAFLLAHGMLEYPLEYAYFLLPLGIIVGGVLALDQQSKTISVSRWLMCAVVVLGGAILTVIFTEYRVIEEDGRLMRFETARIGSVRAESAAPPVIFLTQLRERHRFARTEATVDMSGDEIEWMGKVAHRYAYPPAFLRYSSALFLNNRAEEARLELIRLRQLHGEKPYVEGQQNLKMLAEQYPQLKVSGN